MTTNFEPQGKLMTTTEMTKIDTTTATLSPEAEEFLRIMIQRRRANLLCFWHLCAKAVCRRARTCSADPDICMGRLAPFVPEDVRKGVGTLMEGQIDNLSYDEARSRAPLDVQAYESWIALMLESMGDSAPRLRRKSKKHRLPPPEVSG
jgi:hypothetical protein